MNFEQVCDKLTHSWLPSCLCSVQNRCWVREHHCVVQHWGWRVSQHEVSQEHCYPARALLLSLNLSGFFLCSFIYFYLIFIELMGWHWLIKLYRFQVYDSVTHHLYIVLCVHHPKPSLLPTPFILLYPLLHLPTPLPSGNHHTVLLVYVSFFFSFLSSSLFLLKPLFQPASLPTPFWHLSVFSLYLWVCFYSVC